MSRFFLLFSILFSSLLASDKVSSLLERYPEILWLADLDVKKTEEGKAGVASFSEQMFGQKFVEFDRTLMTLHCLHLFVDGSDEAYEIFTRHQKESERLQKHSFIALHFEAKAILQSGWGNLSEGELLQAMETSLVLGDLGKSGKARQLYLPYGIEAQDHDDFYGEVMREAPDLCPSFQRLPRAAKKLLQKTANLAHYRHIFHLEGEPQMFSQLKKSKIAFEDPIALAFDLFVHTCDIAGALGHVNNVSSLAYKEMTHQAEKSMERAVWSLSNPTFTEWDAYDVHLETLASWLGFDPSNRTERALTRAGAMLRLYTLQEGNLLKKGVEELDSQDREEIVSLLDPQLGEELPRTPTYMPAVLVNLSNQVGLIKAVRLGLPFIARVLKVYKEEIAAEAFNPNIPLNFNKMAFIAKTYPKALQDPFYIDEDGNVLPGCPLFED